jgi:hypothetical protein
MIVALLLAAAGLAFLAWSLAADPAAALDTLARARLELLALGALCLLGQTALVAATWSRLLVAAGGPALSLRDAYRLVYLPAASKYLPGGGVWAIVATAALARGLGVAATASATASTSLIVLVGAAGAALGAAAYALWAAAAPVWTALGLALVAVSPLVAAPLIRDRRARCLLVAAAAAGGSWVPLGLGTFAVAAALAPVSPTDLLLLLAGSAASWIAAVAAVGVPGGIGVREAVQAAAAAPLFPPVTAVAYALLVRIAITAADLAAFALAWTIPDRRRAPLPAD